MNRTAITILMLAMAAAVFSARAAENGYSVTAKSLSYEDVSAAVKDVRSHEPDGHGTIYLPAGDADWGMNRTLRVLGGIDLIGQGTNSTTIRWSRHSALISYNAKEEDDKDLDFSAMRVSGIKFIADESSHGTALDIRSIEGFRVDHCSINTTRKSSYMMLIRSKRSHHPRPYGVIDHCAFSAKGPGTYGVYIGCYRWANGDQNYTEYLGKLENVFIEDCSFDGVYHHIALFSGGTAVFRHNTAKNATGSILDSHELSGPLKNPDGTEQNHGGRFMEVYNNVFLPGEGKSQDYTLLRTRNGGGVMFGNIIKAPRFPFSFVYGPRTVASTDPPGAYPGLDQIHYWWIWDNELTDVKFPKIRHEGEYGKTNIQKDRDYFLRAPDPKIVHTNDCFNPGFREPDYKPFTYPHPLVSSTSSE